MHQILIALVISLLFSASESGQDAQAIAEAAKAQGVEVTPDQVKQALESQRSAQQTPTEQAQQPQPEQPTQPVQPAPQPSPGLSTIEQLLSGRMPSDVSKDLRQFGYDVFARSVSTFAPITNVPVGPDYIIGPGDSFTITMWGRQNDQITVTVDRDGKIALPQVGVLNVAGMTFSKLQEYVDSELRRKFQDFKMHITMGRLRTITVYVVGEAVAPGSYTLSALSTVINALFAAGGPTKNGTLRRIRLLRTGQEPVVLDLYDFLLGGQRQNDVRLAEGDTIHIPLIGPVVGVAGNVKRPAIYEMSEPMTLKQVLDLAGGVTYAGWLQHVQVERVEAHSRRIVVDFDLSGATEPDNPQLNTPIQDGDLVKVYPVADLEQNVIYLEGHVVRPGKYQLKPGMRLSDVLDYETFLPQVNLEYAEVQRLVPPDMHPIVIPFNLGKILKGDHSEDLRLERFDRIRLYRWDQKGKRSVVINGMVYQPGEYRLVEGMRLKELIDAAGGLQKDAYLQRAVLTRRYIDPNGVMQTRQEYVDLSKAMEGDPNNDIVLQDYDELRVLRVPRWAFHDKVVTVSGLVQDPNSYPLYEGMRVSDLIIWAGGLQKDAYVKQAELVRYHRMQEGVRTEKIEIDLERAMAGDPQHDIELQDTDHLVVRPIPDSQLRMSARISGQVRFPGTYPIRKGERISSLIERAGGFTDKAYLKGAIFTRRSAMAVQQERLDQMIRQLEQSLLATASGEAAAAVASDAEAVQAQQLTVAARKELLNKLRAAKVDGRVVVRLEPLDRFVGSSYDIELEDGDELVIPQQPGIVSVIGEVFNPTSLLYEPGQTVGYYLNKVGGLTKDADRSEVYVIKADGSVISMAQSGSQRIAWDGENRMWRFGSFMSVPLDPGDTIIVPRKLDKIPWIRTTKDITQILFQIAVAAGVVLAI